MFAPDGRTWNAVRQERHRARLGPRERRLSHGPKPPRPGGFDAGEFVAVDGEGFNVGPEQRAVMERRVKRRAVRTEYKSREHHYALLAASDGSEVHNPHGALSTKECLDFLLEIPANNKQAIIVMFGASYDWTHMLRDLPREVIAELLEGDADRPWEAKRSDFTLTGRDGVSHDYRLMMLPRKSLRIWRWQAGEDKYVQKGTRLDGTEIWRMSVCAKCTVWDTWGFFQGSFVDALKDRLPSHPDTARVAGMKAKRSTFERAEIQDVREYNRIELKLLVELMEQVREGHRALGLRLLRWDGVGASAAAAFRKFSVKKHLQPEPPGVLEASLAAFAGGHIEAMAVGHHDEPVHHYDVSSAYPHQLRQLPSLDGATWQHGASSPVPAGMTLVHVQFRWCAGRPFYPLFFRDARGGITYPEYGSGWYHYAEYAVAAKWAKKNSLEFRVTEWWHCTIAANERPFAWVEDFFAARAALVAESKRSGVPNGLQHTYKIAINAGYGKLVQQVGARMDFSGDAPEVKPPAYFQPLFGGYITAGCRAQLMEAALQKPHAIIAFATDGIFATERLDLDCPAEKTLGAWEYECHAGITMVMPGVYWLYDAPSARNPSGITHHSRGFDKRIMQSPDFVHDAWRKGQDHADVELSRMVTLGTSLTSDFFWHWRGRFMTQSRALALNGDNSKRQPLSGLATRTAASRLVKSRPRDPQTPFWDELDESAPYELEWADWLALATGERTATIAHGFADFLVADHMAALDA